MLDGMAAQQGDPAPEPDATTAGAAEPARGEDGTAGALRRAREAGERTERGRRRLREMTADGQSARRDDPDRDRTARSHDWTAYAQDQAARMHDSAAALHDQAALLGIGDEQDHRRRAEHHREAARSNRTRTASEPG